MKEKLENKIRVYLSDKFDSDMDANIASDSEFIKRSNINMSLCDFELAYNDDSGKYCEYYIKFINKTLDAEPINYNL